jgi:hypothetical protein
MIENKVMAEFSIWVDRNIIAASLFPDAGGRLEVVEVYRESFAGHREKGGELYALVDPRDWEVVGIISVRSREEDILLMPLAPPQSFDKLRTGAGLAEFTGPHYLLCPIYRVTRIH